MAKSRAGACSSWTGTARELDFTCIAVIVSLGVATGVVQHLQPVQRPVFIYDATISYKFVGDHEFPFWLAVLIPFLALLATAAAVEYVCLKRGVKRATAAFINVILAAVAAIAVIGFLTELFKRICGRLRPDFLDRCQPTVVNGITYEFGTFPNVDCKDINGKFLPDGHMSFPSGHSSCSMTFGLFSALYLLWSVFGRDNGAISVKLLQPANTAWSAKLKGELLSFCILLVVLFDVAWAWGIAASRFRDNRHNVSDVVAGLLLAVCFVPVFFTRLVNNINQWTAYHEQVAAEDCQVLPITASQADMHLNNMHAMVASVTNGSCDLEMAPSSHKQGPLVVGSALIAPKQTLDEESSQAML